MASRTRTKDTPLMANRALRRENWLVRIADACLAEIDAVLRVLRDNPMTTIALDPADYRLASCRRMMKRVRATLDRGAGFAVLDKLPVEPHPKDALTAVYWLLSLLIARQVAQSFDGTLIYDVHDTGKKIATRVRGDLTSQKLGWHTDYGFNHPPPYIGLLVLRTAKSGGENHVVQTIAIAHAMNQAPHAHFRFCVLAADPAHPLAALRGRKIINHVVDYKVIRANTCSECTF